MASPPSKRVKLDAETQNQALTVSEASFVDFGHRALPKEIWQHVLLFLPISSIASTGMTCSYFRALCMEADFVKHIVARPETRRLFSNNKEQFWCQFLDAPSRDVTRSSILEDLASQLSFDAIIAVCQFDDSWSNLIATLSAQLLAPEEPIPTRIAAANTLRVFSKDRLTAYSIPYPSHFGSLCLDLIKSTQNDKLIAAVLRLLSELQIPDSMEYIQLAIDLMSRSKVIQPAGFALIGMLASTDLYQRHFTTEMIAKISDLVESTIKDETNDLEVIHEALSMCCNLVELDADGGTDSRGFIMRYISTSLPALLVRFQKGSPINLIIDSGVVLNMMTPFAAHSVKERVVPFIRANMLKQHEDPRVCVSALSLLGILCEINDPSVLQLVRSYVPEILDKLEPSTDKSVREAALFVVDQIPKHHIAALCADAAPPIPGGPAVPQSNPALDALVDRILEAMRDQAPMIVQRSLYALENLVSSLPLALNTILARRYKEVFDAALEILRRPSESVYPEIIFAVDDLLGLLIIHCPDEEFPFLVERASQLISMLEMALNSPPVAANEPGSEATVTTWELNYDQPHLKGPESTTWTPSELEDRNRRAQVSVISSALSSVLQRLPQPQMTSFTSTIPLAINALARWGFSDDTMMLLWNIFELLPQDTFTAHIDAFREAASNCFDGCNVTEACDASRWLVDMGKTLMVADSKPLLDIEWIIPALLKKLPQVPKAPKNALQVAERAAVQRALAGVATALGAKIVHYIESIMTVLKYDVDLIHDPVLGNLEQDHVSLALMDLTFAACTNFAAILITLNRDCPELHIDPLYEMIAAFVKSLYDLQQMSEEEQRRVPVAFRRDPHSQGALDSKLLLLARTLQGSVGAEKAEILLGKALSDQLKDTDFDTDAVFEDIIEMGAI